MKVLLVNKFHYLKGGSEKYYFELAKLLKENGHEIAFFSMFNEKNIQTGEKEYFVNPIDLNSNNKLKALDVIYSKENKKKMEQALEDFQPDIVHINNFQRQLSASIIDAIKEKNIPIIYTAHDLQAICPAIVMLDNEKKVCEECIKGRYGNCIKKKCIKESKLKSILGALEGKYYRQKKIYTKKIDKIITPSDFFRKKLIEDGIPKEKIQTLPNFIEIKEYQLETIDEGYILYLGRLSREKGILDLIEAVKKIPEAKLKIAGEGPEKDTIQNLIKENGLGDRIQLLGFLNQEQVKEEIRRCHFMVIPSIWYENCPYSVLETLSTGKPIIGSNKGGIPELVINEENGYIYTNQQELIDKMKFLLQNKEIAQKMGEKAKKKAKKCYDKQIYYQNILEVYQKLVKGEKKNAK